MYTTVPTCLTCAIFAAGQQQPQRAEEEQGRDRGGVEVREVGQQLARAQLVHLWRDKAEHHHSSKIIVCV